MAKITAHIPGGTEISFDSAEVISGPSHWVVQADEKQYFLPSGCILVVEQEAEKPVSSIPPMAPPEKYSPQANGRKK